MHKCISAPTTSVATTICFSRLLRSGPDSAFFSLPTLSVLLPAQNQIHLDRTLDDECYFARSSVTLGFLFPPSYLPERRAGRRQPRFNENSRASTRRLEGTTAPTRFYEIRSRVAGYKKAKLLTRCRQVNSTQSTQIVI